MDRLINKNEQKIVLIISLLSYFLTALCSSIVITGLAKISLDLHLNQSTLSWVQNAYGLAFGSFILLGGRIGDVFGKKSVLNIALIIFSVGSIIAGFTISPYLMIFARLLQGIGAAIIAPTSMALLIDYFEGPSRVKAIAWYSSISGLGASIGLVLGGFLASFFSWRIGFYLNVPVALLMLILSIKVLKSVKVEKPKLDIWGTLLSIIGSFALVYTVDGAKNMLPWLLVTLVSIILFIMIEAKHELPIMPLVLFKNKTRTNAYIIRALLVGGMLGFWFFISEYLQDVLNFSPLLTGFAFFPMTLTLFVTAILIPRLVNVFGNKKVLLAAAFTLLIGFVWIVYFDKGNYWISVAVPMLFFGIGQGLGLTPLTNLGIYKVKPENSGAASGLVNSAHQLGGALGLAIMVTISAHLVSGTNMASEFHISMIIGLILTVVLTILSFLIPNNLE